MKRYLTERRDEFVKIVPIEAISVAVPAYEFLSKQVLKHHSEVTPSFARSVEVLEHLLVSFFEHSMKPDLLKQMENAINENLTI